MIVLFGIILLISIYNNIQIHLLNNDYSSFFGYSVFEVQTGSMKGTIDAGDWIVVEDTDDIALDDIITFKQGDEFTTHRVIEKYSDTYVTKGDANNTKDEPITDDQIVGKVVKILPNFGILRKTLFNPIVIIAIIVTLFLISYAMKKEDKEKEKQMFSKIKATFTKVKEKSVPKKKEAPVVQQKATPLKKEKPKKKKEAKVEVQKIHEAKEDVEMLDVETLPLSDEDLDKTMYFRMIPVDKSDLEPVYSEPENLIEEEEEVVVSSSVPEEPQKEEKTLEVLQNKRKKCKNILEKAMLLKTEELNDLIKILNFNQEYKLNEPTIKEAFLKTYIDAKYYNYCGDVNTSYDNKNMLQKLDKIIDLETVKLIRDYNGSDTKYTEKAGKFNIIFKIINYVEKYSSIQDLKEKREKYKNKLLEHLDQEYFTSEDFMKMVNKIIQIQKTYYNQLQEAMEKMKTNLFHLKYSKIVNQKIYGVKMSHNLSFSKVYSDYIIEKTYNEGIIAEDKLEVLLNLLMVRLVKDMYRGNFSNKYLFHLPNELYDKSNKLDDIYNLIDDEYAKQSIITLVDYQDIKGNKTVMKSLIKQGYHFAVYLGDMEEIKESDLDFMYMMEYLFISIKNKKLKTKLPKDLRKKIVFDDVMRRV